MAQSKQAQLAVWKDRLDNYAKSRETLYNFCKKWNLSESSFRKNVKKLFPERWEQVKKDKKPKTSQYKLGRSFEYRVKKHFEKDGYYVIRAASSKGAFDLVAINHEHVYLIQCKRSGGIKKSELDEAISIALKIKRKFILVEPDSRKLRITEFT